MGLFDDVRVKYQLPWPEVQDNMWQSKDTPAQYLDLYEIREDGTLWHQAYDERLEENSKYPIGRDNKRWEQVKFTGELEIHEIIQSKASVGMYYSCRFWFRSGVVHDVTFVARESGIGAKERIPE